MSNGVAALNADFRFCMEMSSFCRRASQIIAYNKETICAVDPIAASCLSKITLCPTSSCDTVDAVFDFHLGGKRVGILVSNGADRQCTTFLCATVVSRRAS